MIDSSLQLLTEIDSQAAGMEEPIDVHVASDVTDEDASLIKPNANQNSTIAVPKGW